MDRTKLKEFFKLFNEDTVIEKTKKGTTLVFARADMSDVNRIEKMTNEELLESWLSLACMIDIESCFSICDLQMDQLYGMEITSRGLTEEAKERWKKIKNEKK